MNVGVVIAARGISGERLKPRARTLGAASVERASLVRPAEETLLSSRATFSRHAFAVLTSVPTESASRARRAPEFPARRPPGFSARHGPQEKPWTEPASEKWKRAPFFGAGIGS